MPGPTCSLESAPLTRLPQLPAPASQNCRETPFDQLLPLASSQLKKKKKKKLFVPEREVGGIMCAICTYWSATPFHLLWGCSTRPLSKETHRGRCVLCLVSVCLCVCVLCVCMCSVCDMRTQDLFLSADPSPIFPSHPINSLKQLINAILLDPKGWAFQQSSFLFLCLGPFRESDWPHILQRVA